MTEFEPEISADVAQFLARCIDTVPHLEGLLLMWESAPQIWTDTAIAARIYVAPQTAQQVVQDLERHQLIASCTSAANGYVFNSQSEAAALLPALARAYRNHLVPVTHLIHSKRS